MLIFLNVRTLFTRNLFTQAKQLTSITGRFYNVWVNKSAKNVWNNVRNRTGSFSMTIHCHTLLQFLDSRNMVVAPHPPYSPDFTPCDFFLFPRMKLQLKGCSSRMSLKFRNNCWRPTCDSKTSIPVVLPTVAEMLDPLHKFGRGLLWRWQQRAVTKVSKHFIIDSVWELSDIRLIVSIHGIKWDFLYLYLLPWTS
jgi:hypothetical protein